MSKIDDLCRKAGVRIFPARAHCGPRQTRARQVLRRIVDKHGEGHLLFVLRTIVESRNNAAELKAETIYAVSDIILKRREWADRGLAFLEAFDSIELGPLREEAKSLPVSSKRVVLAVMIAERLKPIMEPQQQGTLI